MKFRSFITIILITSLILFATACGGGGGGGSDEVEGPWLCFTANTSNSSVTTKIQGTLDVVPTLEYSTNGSDWSAFVIGETTVKLKNKGDKVYIRGDNSSFAKDGVNFINFVLGGSIKASGNIMSLVDKSCKSTTIPSNECFISLFLYCENLITPPDLPATTLTYGCYGGMFAGCRNMTTAPALPATTLIANCYQHMFCDCDHLSTAPVLPATDLADGCYATMFLRCSSLNSITVSFTDWNTAGLSTSSWVEDVPAGGTFTCPAGLDTSINDADHVPTGWTIQH
jgi:hypothetical protein